MSIAPPALTPSRWTPDIDGLVSVINNATQYVNIEVMDYDPVSKYSTPNTFWPVIDDAIRTAVFEFDDTCLGLPIQ